MFFFYLQLPHIYIYIYIYIYVSQLAYRGLFLYRRAVLEKWKLKLGSGATYTKLIESFEHAGQYDLAEVVSKACSNCKL